MQEKENDRCAQCGAALERRQFPRPLCDACDERFEREIAAWLAFIAVCRSSSRPAA